MTFRQHNLFILYLLKTLFYCGLLIVPHALADETTRYRQSLKQITKQISVLSEKLNADSGLLKSQRTRLKETEEKIIKNHQQIGRLKQEITVLQHDLDTSQRQLVTGQQALHQQAELLRQLIVQQYKTPKQAFLKQILKQQNRSRVARLAQYWEYYQRAVMQEFAQINQAQARVSEALARQQQQLKNLQAKKTDQQRQQAELSNLKAQRLETLSKLDKDIQQDQQKIGQLQKDRQRLNLLLVEIEQQANHLTQSSAKHTPFKGGFTGQRASLNSPVDASTEYRFGQRIAKSGMRSQGIFFRGESGTQVRAIYRGRVLFADYLKGYGLLIIIDHGDNHISLYGHNQVLLYKVGDEVNTNDPIAEMGVSGGLKSPGLYFEIRENTAPVNPENWLQL